MSLRSTLPVAAALAAAFMLTSCGGSSTGTTSSTATSTPAASTSTAAVPTATTATSPPDEFRQALINHSGFTEQQATCIVNYVLKKIGRAKFDRLYGKGNAANSVESVILAANFKCAPRGAGQ